jgi:hypothetical protein
MARQAAWRIDATDATGANCVQRIWEMLPLWDETIPGRAWRDSGADLTPESTLHHLGIFVFAPWTTPHIYRERNPHTNLPSH